MIALLLAAFLQDKDDPEAELRSFKVADGYEVNLFASEKEGVVKPLQIRWDPRGRLWVTCGPSYPQLRPGEEADDTIVVLEDRDGDGRADKSRVFARGLSTPMGLEIGRGGVYVGSGGELIHLKEAGGEGSPPEKSVLLKGFFTGDSHQNINSFVWGPGGELLFCQGLHATARVETPWGVERLEKAGVWRLRDRTLRLDPFLGYDMGPQNPYGIVFDDWGQPIVVAGNGQGIYYLLPAMVRSAHFFQIAQIWDKTNKLAGADFLGGAHWPEELQGVMVSGVFLNNAVYGFRFLEDGAGFRAVSLPPIILSSHSSFRPVDVRVGPDGAVYVADWYNPVIGHYQASFRHPDRDKTRGRIWRISAKGRPAVKPPNLALLTVPQLLEQLRSPERWTRYQARRVLADREQKEVAPALGKWLEGIAADDPIRDRLNLEAIGLYETHDVAEPAFLRRLLRAKEPRLRAYATRVISRWHDRLPDALDLLAASASDEHPRVRLEAVVAASAVPHPRSVEVAALAVDRPVDRFIHHALTQAVHALKPHWKPAFDAGAISFGNRADRIQFVLRADGTRDVLQSLLSLLRREDLSKEVRGSALSLLASTGGPEELALVLKDGAFEANATRVLDELAGSFRLRRAVPSGDWTAALRGWMKGPLRPQAATLAGLWRIEALRGELEAAGAYEALADLGGASTYLAARARAGPDRSGAVIALLRLDLAAAASEAIPLLSEPIVTAFLSRQGGSEALARALEAAPPPADAAKLGLRAMSTAGRQDPALRGVLSKAAGISSVAPEYTAEFVRELGREALAEGDPVRGEKVFRGTLTNCVSCHAIGGAGGKLGPDVSAVGTGLPVDMMIESVLWPNRQVKEGYSSTAVITKDDAIYQGFKVNEDRQTLILRDPNVESLIRLPIADLRARKEIGSVMPEGLTNALTRAELRDLIRFLCDLGKPGPFRVPDRPFVRRWEAAGPGGTWVPSYATVAGEFPLDERRGPLAIRFEVEVLQAGRFALSANSTAGLSREGAAWPEGLEIDLARGRHAIAFTLDPAKRGGAGLRLEVAPASGSKGELRLIQ